MCLCAQFFVASDPNVKTDRLWHDKYSLRKSMIPTFITMDQARKVKIHPHTHTHTPLYLLQYKWLFASYQPVDTHINNSRTQRRLLAQSLRPAVISRLLFSFVFSLFFLRFRFCWLVSPSTSCIRSVMTERRQAKSRQRPSLRTRPKTVSFSLSFFSCTLTILQLVYVFLVSGSVKSVRNFQKRQ